MLRSFRQFFSSLKKLGQNKLFEIFESNKRSYIKMFNLINASRV